MLEWIHLRNIAELIKPLKKNLCKAEHCTAEIKPLILTGGRPLSRKLDYREQCIYKTNFVVHVTSCHWELRQEEKEYLCPQEMWSK